MSNKHTISDLYQMQSLPLSVKIRMTERRIKEWVDEFGIDGVYVSFSGGKDSTVLLHIARKLFPNIKAMFVDVPTQYPELRDFAKTFDNVDIVRPKIGFKEVCEKYGFPLISKEVSLKVSEAKRNKNGYAIKSFIPECNGGRKGKYNLSKYKFLLYSKFDISNKCCDIMKKNPSKKYEKQTKRKPITGTMAEESMARTTEWIKNGCNAFNKKRVISNPMSFWTEQDVLLYIKTNNLPICSVYGDIVVDYDAEDNVEGQMDMSELSEDMGIFDLGNRPLKTTGCDRTGCALCGFGCHLEKSPNRFEMLKETHLGLYGLLDKMENNGITYRQAIDWINEHGNMNIKY